MADHVITLAQGQFGPSPDSNGKIYEDVLITGGSGGGTTGAYVTQFVKVPERVLGGPGTFSISGRTVTFAGTLAQDALSSARIIGSA